MAGLDSALVVCDIGNTNFHFGVVRDGLIQSFTLPNQLPKKTSLSDGQEVSELAKSMAAQLAENCQLHEIPPDAKWLCVSVHSLAVEVLQRSVDHLCPNGQFRLLDHNDIPMKSSVVDRKKTGIDRLLSGWTAASFYGSPAIVVDAGSAVTVDWVDDEMNFRGGMIFPGIGLSARSLKLDTDALPEVKLDDPLAIVEDVYGRDTRSAIQAGIFWSQWGGICHAVKRLQQLGDHRCSVVLTGGGMTAFESLVPADWRYDPELNLKGLLELAVEIFS